MQICEAEAEREEDTVLVIFIKTILQYNKIFFFPGYGTFLTCLKVTMPKRHLLYGFCANLERSYLISFLSELDMNRPCGEGNKVH